MTRFLIFKVLFDYIVTRKAWFLAPLFVVFGIMVVIAVFVQTSPLFLPFIYAGF